MERGVKVRSLVISLALLGSVAAAWLVSSVPSAAQSGAVRDPVAHCRTVGNQNEPPGWDRAPRAIARAAGGSAHNYGVHWRCADGQVLVCAVEDMHEVSCSKRDRRRQAEVPGYCRQVPNASFIPFSEGNRRSVYDWRCRGTIPVIARRLIAEHELDPAGYVKAEWKPVAATRRPAAAAAIQVTVEVTSPARVRNHPSANGSAVLKTMQPGEILSGEWVPADHGPGRWLRVELASLEIEDAWPYGYVWEGNLRVLRQR